MSTMIYQSSEQWRTHDFPEGGAGASTLTNFSQKLHGSEEILAQRGREGRAPPLIHHLEPYLLVSLLPNIWVNIIVDLVVRNTSGLVKFLELISSYKNLLISSMLINPPMK